MNNRRRSALRGVIDLLERCNDAIDSAMTDEQDYLDNMPENLQSSDRAEKAEDAVDNLQDAYDSIGEAIDSIQSAIE